MRKQQSKNAGYSFVELVIVIAIMMILAGLSTLTLYAVNNAKYKQAATTLQSELSTLRTTAMAQDGDMALKLVYIADGTVMNSRKLEGGYYLIRGYVRNGAFVDPKTDTVDSADTSLAALDYYEYAGANYPIQVIKDTRGSVYYDGAAVTADGVVIQFNKSDGSVAQPSAAGTSTYSFSICKKKTTEVAKKVQLKATTGMCETVQ